MSIPEVERLDCLTYFRLRRDAVITKYRSTAAGKEYLDKCWVYEQTEPDREALRKTFGEGRDD